MNPTVKGREEFLDAALQCGAELTGKFDGSEPVTVLFTPDAWCKFDRAQEAKVAEAREDEAAKREFVNDGRVDLEKERRDTWQKRAEKAEAENRKLIKDVYCGTPGTGECSCEKFFSDPMKCSKRVETFSELRARLDEDKALIKQMSEATVQSQKEYFELRDRMIKGEPAVKITVEEVKYIADIHSKAQAYDALTAAEARTVLTDEQITDLARQYNLDGSMLLGSRMGDYVRPFARAVLAASAALAAQEDAKDAALWREWLPNAKYLLDHCESAIRCCYKHGDENIIESMCVTFLSLQGKMKSGRAANTPKGT